MKLAVGLLLLIGGGIWILRQSFTAHHVSAAWQNENNRREWGAGVDQSCWTWPYRGHLENPRFNAAQLRKRA